MGKIGYAGENKTHSSKSIWPREEFSRPFSLFNWKYKVIDRLHVIIPYKSRNFVHNALTNKSAKLQTLFLLIIKM